MFFIIYVSLSIKITLKHLNTIEYTVPESPPVNKSTVGVSLYLRNDVFDVFFSINLKYD